MEKVNPSDSSTEEYKVLEEIVSSTDDDDDENPPPTKRRKEEYPPQTTAAALEDINSDEEPSDPSKSLLESVSSSEETEELAKPEPSQTQHQIVFQKHDPEDDNLDPKDRNERDLQNLVNNLEEDPSFKQICLFCYRVGHHRLFCQDKRNKTRRLAPLWRQGKMQRKYIFNAYHPELLEKERKRQLTKKKQKKGGRNKAEGNREETDKPGTSSGCKIVEEIVSSADEEEDVPKIAVASSSSILGLDDVNSSSSDSLEEISDCDEESLSQPTGTGTSSNEMDLKNLLLNLDEDPTFKNVCFFCYRVGHKSVACQDKKNKNLREVPGWREGKIQRKRAFFEYHPEVRQGEIERQMLKNERRKLRKKVERLEETAKKQEETEREKQRKKLETVQELLEMARKLME